MTVPAIRPGEIIPIELEFGSDVREPIRGGRRDLWPDRCSVEGYVFHVEPLDAVTDPMLDYLASRGVVVGSFIGT